jgi:hypothetical protein
MTLFVILLIVAAVLLAFGFFARGPLFHRGPISRRWGRRL